LVKVKPELGSRLLHAAKEVEAATSQLDRDFYTYAAPRCVNREECEMAIELDAVAKKLRRFAEKLGFSPGPEQAVHAKTDLGEWRINSIRHSGFGATYLPYIAIAVDGHVAIHVVGNGRAESMVQAALVTAAPKLLAALKLAQDAMNTSMWNGEYPYIEHRKYRRDMEQISAAIADAESADELREEWLGASTT
jgi:hypothetical protein